MIRIIYRTRSAASPTCGGAATPRQEFHVHRSIREALSLDHALFSIAGTVVFADIDGARRFSHAYERMRRSSGHTDPAVRAGEVVAMGVLDEISHHIFAMWRDERGTEVLSRALAQIRTAVGVETAETAIVEFCRDFPPAAVHRGELTIDEYLDTRVEGLTGRERTLEEMVMLRLAGENGAAARYGELFDARRLHEETGFTRVVDELERFFDAEPIYSAGGGPEAAGLHDATGQRSSVVELLRAPMRARPGSLEEQLAYAREHWASWIGRFLPRLLRSMDILREEAKVHAEPGAAPPPAEVYQYDSDEQARFSPDTEWMPGVVLMAKSTLVWLYQLSNRYGREIRRLDQIPDEELDTLAAGGFNALWLIGLWERSPASRRIKHLSGNPDAEASAYALHAYDIAGELGGWPALEALRRRCSDRGIRLASDMVPNHTGIDSPWVHEHPDWYVQVDHPPYPSYSFTGENLSGRGDISVQIEDHYFDRTDAAVVFRHVDQSGRERFIYHGNDGTSMPWNDTAQLNYLNPETREAVIQTILHVARNFPVIRFDAAMTLAKRHFRRLWFPEPGSGGDIASRAEHGLTREEFDRAMPNEFWREVVERVAREAPGTLLLAEAFWMMEGYFVRTLGMHRVYNSGFMHMLKREQNADYREIIRTTLEFDPKILERFVNFMNNPDEESAVTQFGTGDKYFTVATMLATLPGLPMFGHGQMEGLAEKYGMEFRRPYWDESPDGALMERHEREIMPLLRRRKLFAGASSFRLFDLRRSDGSVNENVFVYTNESNGDAALVACNNAYDGAEGTITGSAAVHTPDGPRSTRIDEALGISGGPGNYLVMQEQRSGLWYLRKSDDVRSGGLTLALEGYQNVVYWNVHERTDDDEHSLERLEAILGGRGVPDIDLAVKALALQPMRDAFATMARPDLLSELDAAMQGYRTLTGERFDRFRSDLRLLLERARTHAGTASDEGVTVARAIASAERHLSTLVTIPHRAGDRRHTGTVRRAHGYYYTGLRFSERRRRVLTEWLLLVPVVEAVGERRATAWGIETWPADGHDAKVLRPLLARADWPRRTRTAAELVRDLFGDSEVLTEIGFNTHAGVDFYHQESLEEVLWLLFASGFLRLLATSPAGGGSVRDEIAGAFQVILEIDEANQRARGRARELLAAFGT